MPHEGGKFETRFTASQRKKTKTQERHFFWNSNKRGRKPTSEPARSSPPPPKTRTPAPPTRRIGTRRKSSPQTARTPARHTRRTGTTRETWMNEQSPATTERNVSTSVRRQKEATSVPRLQAAGSRCSKRARSEGGRGPVHLARGMVADLEAFRAEENLPPTTALRVRVYTQQLRRCAEQTCLPADDLLDNTAALLPKEDKRQARVLSSAVG